MFEFYGYSSIPIVLLNEISRFCSREKTLDIYAHRSMVVFDTSGEKNVVVCAIGFTCSTVTIDEVDRRAFFIVGGDSMDKSLTMQYLTHLLNVAREEGTEILFCDVPSGEIAVYRRWMETEIPNQRPIFTDRHLDSQNITMFKVVI